MDDVVAVAVRTEKNEWYGFVTWGRLWHPVDDTKLLEVVMRDAARSAINGTPQEARLCFSLRDVRSAPYFYEALVEFSSEWGERLRAKSYERWVKKKRRKLEEGREIYFVGKLDDPPPSLTKAPDAAS